MKILIRTTAMLLVVTLGSIQAYPVTASTQLDEVQRANQQQMQQALHTQECGRRYDDCQSQCVHIEIINPANTSTSSTRPASCDAKNNRISQCRNNCYVEYTRCVGG